MANNGGMPPPGVAQQQYFRGQQNMYPSSAPFPQSSAVPQMPSSHPQQFSNPARTAPYNSTGYSTPPDPSQPSQMSNGAPQQVNSIQTSQPPMLSQSTAAQAATKSTAQTPVPQAVLVKEQEKVTHLLGLNSLLLQEVVSLQSNGKGGTIGQPVPQKEDDMAGKTAVPAKEYIDCMRCLQSNLAYLAQLSPQKPVASPTVRGPAIMDPPPGVPQAVKDAYEKLKPLFPGWNGVPKPSPRQSNAPLPSGQPGLQTQPSNTVSGFPS